MIMTPPPRRPRKALPENGLTTGQILEIKRSARIEWARRCAKRKDILGWGQALFPHKFNLPFCHELHDYFVQIRREPLTATEAPRGHAKTTVKCFLVPAFQALEESSEFQCYLNVQATDDKALAINRGLKLEFEDNAELREIYGELAGERWTDAEFVLKNGVIFRAIGAGKSIRGTNYRNIRPDYIIVDDLYDDEDINNPDATLKKNAWFWSSLYQARSKSRRSCIHVQGTAINDQDILEEAKKKGFVHKTFKAVKNWDTGEVLWKELNQAEQTLKGKTAFELLQAERVNMGSVIFLRELQNERRDDATSIVKKAWLKDWEYEPATLDLGHRHHTLAAVMLQVDPSIGEKNENDFTGMALVLKTQWDDGRGNEWYVEGLWNEHLTLDGRIQKVQAIADARPAGRKLTRVIVEAIAGFKDFSAELRRRTNLPVREIDYVKDKISNLENKSHYFENKKVFLNKHIEPRLKDMLVYQLTTNHPQNDDLRDAVLLGMETKSGGLWTGYSK
jgi:hypothetical protein